MKFPQKNELTIHRKRIVYLNNRYTYVVAFLETWEQMKIQETPFIILPILVTFLFVSHFLITIHFSKKHHSLQSLSHLLIAQNIYKAFFVHVNIKREI
jgi:hypothetical protein